MPPLKCQCLKSWSPESSQASPSYPMPSISPVVPADPPPGPPLQPPLTPDSTPRAPAQSDLLDGASSSSSSSCPPCSPEPGTEAPGPEPAAATVRSSVSGEGRSEKGRLYCPTCKVTVNSASQLQAHNTGQCAPSAGVRGGRGAGRLPPPDVGTLLKGLVTKALCSVVIGRAFRVFPLMLEEGELGEKARTEGSLQRQETSYTARRPFLGEDALKWRWEREISCGWWGYMR